MLRGAIDLTTPDMIGGWIYSEAFGVRSLPVLAFLDDACVGSGKVTEFRRDLADAGLGDGYLGFKFRISVNSPEDVRRVVVKLEASDAVFVQQGSRITGADAIASIPRRRRPATRRLNCLRWMRERDWLNQAEYDFLTLIDQAGVYDRVLGSAKTGRPSNAPAAPTAVASDLLSLYHMENVELREQHIDAVSDLPGVLTAQQPQDGADFVVALWSEGNARIGVAEGSHLTRPAATDGPAPETAELISYRLSPDRLLFLNSRCRTEARSLAPEQGVRIFYAQPGEAE